MSYADEITDEELNQITRRILSARGFVSVVFIGIGMFTLGVIVWKIIAVCSLLYVLHISHFGTRRIEQAALLMLAIGILSWIEVLPAQPTLANVKQGLAMALNH